jgi:putative membrane protein
MPLPRLLPLAGIALVGSLAFSSAAIAQTAISPADFVKKATSSNQFEIESSRLAESKAQAPEVKAFARQMIADHTKAATEMQAAVKADKAADSAPPKLDPAHQAQLDQLQQASGGNFDTAYVAAQKAAHDEAVSLFSAYAENGVQGALKTFAANTLPTLKQHQAHVKRLSPQP